MQQRDALGNRMQIESPVQRGIATADDQVVAIDKRFLDPRRPTKPTAADREEGLIRYSEVIPILPSNWVTQHRVVHDPVRSPQRLRGV